jgi:chromosomal replication initiator protein
MPKPSFAVDIEAQRQIPRQTNRREPGGDLWQAGVERRIAKLDALESARTLRIANHAKQMRERPRKPVSFTGRPMIGQRVKLESIRLAVERSCGYRLSAEGQQAPLVEARQIAWYLARALTGHSLPQIGRDIGAKHHTTVLSGITKIQRLLRTDADLSRVVRELTGQLTGSLALPALGRRAAQSVEIPCPDLSGEWAI